MKKLIKVAGAAGLFALAACGGGADDAAERNIEAMTENRADALDDAADMTNNGQAEEALEDQADKVREMGEEAAEDADSKDDARIEGQVANQM